MMARHGDGDEDDDGDGDDAGSNAEDSSGVVRIIYPVAVCL
jgi:hypothetical protein